MTDSLLTDLSETSPALTRSVHLQETAAGTGFDWPHARAVLAKVREELAEVEEAVVEGTGTAHLAEEIGDLLFVLANLARHEGIDPESALHATCRKFIQRYDAMVDLLKQAGHDPAEADLDLWDRFWEQAKKGDGP